MGWRFHRHARVSNSLWDCCSRSYWIAKTERHWSFSITPKAKKKGRSTRTSATFWEFIFLATSIAHSIFVYNVSNFCKRVPTPPLSNGTKHYDTPMRVRVLAANDSVDSLSPTTKRRTKITEKMLYTKLHIPQRSARNIVKTRESRRSNHVKNKPEKRGRKKLLTPKDVQFVEQQLVRHPSETRKMNWNQLAKFCG